MFKQIILALGALVAATAFAAVDVNKASQAELESIKGIGPTISAQILGERQKAPFKDWNDLTTRVKGVGDASAAQVLAGRPHRQRQLAFTGPTAAGAAKAAGNSGRRAQEEGGRRRHAGDEVAAG